ncbi:hypothetical protein RvVAR0630_15770 [Agrobacterium vitis]|nr:hypothetical protein RvVAR0630_15770 [Agrobacterium vitis]
MAASEISRRNKAEALFSVTSRCAIRLSIVSSCRLCGVMTGLGAELWRLRDRYAPLIRADENGRKGLWMCRRVGGIPC